MKLNFTTSATTFMSAYPDAQTIFEWHMGVFTILETKLKAVISFLCLLPFHGEGDSSFVSWILSILSQITFVLQCPRWNQQWRTPLLNRHQKSSAEFTVSKRWTLALKLLVNFKSKVNLVSSQVARSTKKWVFTLLSPQLTWQYYLVAIKTPPYTDSH